MFWQPGFLLVLIQVQPIVTRITYRANSIREITISQIAFCWKVFEKQ